MSQQSINADKNNKSYNTIGNLQDLYFKFRLLKVFNDDVHEDYIISDLHVFSHLAELKILPDCISDAFFVIVSFKDEDNEIFEETEDTRNIILNDIVEIANKLELQEYYFKPNKSHYKFIKAAINYDIDFEISNILILSIIL